MELTLGKKTNAELAEWFGISAKSFCNKKKERLEELREYAEFYEEKGKVVITKILNPAALIYIKKSSKSYQTVRDAFDKEWSDNGLDTCKNVSEKIYNKHKNELSIKESTTYQYTISARTELYGKPFVGNCSYLWCKKFVTPEGIVIYEELNEEEQAIKRKILKKHFATDEEKDLMIAEMVNSGEITKEEAYDMQCEMRGLNQEGFVSFLRDLESALGCSIVKGTKIEVGNHVQQLGAWKE